MKAETKDLSQREIECLRWASQGKTAFETAVILGIGTATVQSYRKTAGGKLDATGITHAVAIFIRKGLDK